jgi:RES domain-containing protein
LTSDELQLDPKFFLNRQPFTLYRLARARHSNLSGAGAAFAPGRWNRVGQEAIYTSVEMGVPVLERLVHTPKDLIPANLAVMKIRVSGEWEAQENALVDSRTGGCLWIYRDLAAAKARFAGNPRWFGGGVNPFAVAVPSVVVPVWNVVLYPQGVGFWDHVSLENIEAFKFDPRLFPEGAETEPPEQK